MDEYYLINKKYCSTYANGTNEMINKNCAEKSSRYDETRNSHKALRPFLMP